MSALPITTDSLFPPSEVVNMSICCAFTDISVHSFRLLKSAKFTNATLDSEAERRECNGWRQSTGVKVNVKYTTMMTSLLYILD